MLSCGEQCLVEPNTTRVVVDFILVSFAFGISMVTSNSMSHFPLKDPEPTLHRFRWSSEVLSGGPVQCGKCTLLHLLDRAVAVDREHEAAVVFEERLSYFDLKKAAWW